MRKKKRDFQFSLKTADQLTDKDVISKPEQESRQLLASMINMEDEMQTLYKEIASADALEPLEEEVQVKLRTVKRTSNNIRKAYYTSISLGDELNARWEDSVREKKYKHLPSAPANAWIDLEESKTRHFAQGINLYKVMLICFIGCFAGVVVETIWCLITRGYIESRAGLVYGPFNFLYGLGAVALSLALYKYRNMGKWLSFAGGFVVGSVVEYICSWWQEAFIGSRSWDYSHMPFNINGRICLLYSIFWGLLGVFWIKVLYPWMAKLILKIPNRIGKPLTWALMVFLIINGIVTLIAVFRWSQRVDLIDPSNSFWAFVDARFPNERMERIFANMEFGSIK